MSVGFKTDLLSMLIASTEPRPVRRCTPLRAALGGGWFGLNALTW
jgi:hypothetical protein